MAEQESKPGINGCLWIGAGIGFLLLLGMCSTKKPEPRPFVSPSLENQMEAIEAPPTIDPFDAGSVSRAAQHFKSVTNAAGLSGAMIYSQNCYDALARDFSWKKLDECGAFDMLVVRSTADTDLAGLDSEAQYFDPEAAAGRYLASATKGGEEASKADVRLEAMKQRAARQSLPSKPRASPTPKEAVPVDSDEVANAAEYEDV